MDRNPDSIYGGIGAVQYLPKFDYRYYKVANSRAHFIGFLEEEIDCAGTHAFPNTSRGNASAIEYPAVTTSLTKDDAGEPASYLNNMTEWFTYSSSMDFDTGDYNPTQFIECQPIKGQMYTSRSYKRGNLIKHGIGYPTASGGQVTEYTYNIYDNEKSPILTTDAFVVCDFTKAANLNEYGSYDYGIGKYQIIPFNKTINSETIRENSGLETTTEYEYFYNDYTDALDYNLIKSKKTTSDYDPITSYFTYPRGDGHYLPNPETEVMINGNTIVSRMISGIGS